MAAEVPRHVNQIYFDPEEGRRINQKLAQSEGRVIEYPTFAKGKDGSAIPIQYRDMRHLQAMIRHAPPVEIPVLVRAALELQAIRPIFGTSQPSRPVGPHRELIGMIGVD